jgi:quercetin dioxygenase-like cupin family protein
VSDRTFKSAELVVPAGDLAASVAFFSELGFALESTFPAEAPRVAVLSGFGVRLRLDADARTPPGHLVISCDEPETRELTAPNGMRIELVARGVKIPPLSPSYVVSKLDDDSGWTAGRAGMHYRDLIPDRQGGRFIASHIRLGEGGPVPDYVHFHKLRFQMIYCLRGWTRLLYEGEGPAFVMEAGGCVLQPPEIRHRVLECAAGTEVLEIACPALHETVADPTLALPTEVYAPKRRFGGQTFRHAAAAATWEPSRVPGFRERDLGIAGATGGLADARILKSADVTAGARRAHGGELLFAFVLGGSATLHAEAHRAVPLAAGDAFVIPAGVPFALEDRSTDLELFEIAVA